MNASLYDNATNYAVTQKNTVVYEVDRSPTLSEIVDTMEIDTDDLVGNLTAVTIITENADYGGGYGTSGPLIDHLHGEMRHGGRTYFLLAGKWYEVDSNYIEQVTKDFLAVVDSLDLDRSEIRMNSWKASEGEGAYNETSVVAPVFVNGDRVLTDNVELFDALASDGSTTYIIHVKRGFDVKLRDVRSQIINSAQIIENDLRTGTPAKLNEHYDWLVRRGRTSISRSDFLALFQQPRTYVLAYGSKIKVDQRTISQFESSVARMEIVSLNSQFRQLSSSESEAQLRISWIELVD